MIVLTRLNGTRYGINDEQIERLEDGPNTVVVLVNGNRYTALESVDEVIEAIVAFRARVLDAASIVTQPGTAEAEAHQDASIALFRPHSILGDVEPALEVDEYDEMRRPSLLDAIRPRRKED